MAQEWSYDTSKVYTVHRTVCPCAVAETAGVENEQDRWYMEALVNGQHSPVISAVRALPSADQLVSYKGNEYFDG